MTPTQMQKIAYESAVALLESMDFQKFYGEDMLALVEYQNGKEQADALMEKCKRNVVHYLRKRLIVKSRASLSNPNANNGGTE